MGDLMQSRSSHLRVSVKPFFKDAKAEFNVLCLFASAPIEFPPTSRSAVSQHCVAETVYKIMLKQSWGMHFEIGFKVIIESCFVFLVTFEVLQMTQCFLYTMILSFLSVHIIYK